MTAGRIETLQEVDELISDIGQDLVIRMQGLRRGMGPKREGDWRAADALERVSVGQRQCPAFLVEGEKAADRKAGITRAAPEREKDKDERFADNATTRKAGSQPWKPAKYMRPTK